MPVKILVADDDKAMRDLYSRIFSRTSYTVSMAETFAQASEMIRTCDFDLLITDFSFPDGVGTELIRLFNEGKSSRARTMLVTGASSAVEELRKEGVNALMQKPFKVEDFLAEVGKALA